MIAWNAGVLTTDELIFQGNAEGELVAFEAQTGEKLWQKDLQTGIIAPPITNQIDGTQYISILAGWGGFYGQFYKFTDQINPGTLFTFSLNGKESVPKYFIISQARLKKGIE